MLPLKKSKMGKCVPDQRKRERESERASERARERVNCYSYATASLFVCVCASGARAGCTDDWMCDVLRCAATI
jgi:hypothetical protein